MLLLHFVAFRSSSLNSGRFCCVRSSYSFLRTFGLPFIIITIYALGEKDVIVPTTINGTALSVFRDKSTHFIPCAESLYHHHHPDSPPQQPSVQKDALRSNRIPSSSSPSSGSWCSRDQAQQKTFSTRLILQCDRWAFSFQLFITGLSTPSQNRYQHTSSQYRQTRQKEDIAPTKPRSSFPPSEHFALTSAVHSKHELSPPSGLPAGTVDGCLRSNPQSGHSHHHNRTDTNTVDPTQRASLFTSVLPPEGCHRSNNPIRFLSSPVEQSTNDSIICRPPYRDTWSQAGNTSRYRLIAIFASLPEGCLRSSQHALSIFFFCDQSREPTVQLQKSTAHLNRLCQKDDFVPTKQHANQ